MLYKDLFGPWGLLIIILIGVGIILIAVLLFVCFLTPGCIGYECFRKRNKEDKNVHLRTKNQEEKNLKLNDISYRSWRLGSLYENDNNGTISENVESQRDSLNSVNAQCENVENSSTLNLIQLDKQKNETKLKEFPIELTMSLQYLPPCDDIITGKLVIGIEALSGLPPKQYNGTLEPYVALNIVKQSWSHRKQKLHSFRTRSIRHTASPIYKETFVIANAKSQEAKEWILDITAYDHDRYANHTELSSLKVSLKDMKKIFYSPEIHLFNYIMKPSYQEFGNILLAISYLPTAQRLTINVMKLRNIKFTSVVSSLNKFNPYIRILMLNGKTGKKIKKKKTKFLSGVVQPEFNETLTFDLPITQLDTVQFLIVLCNKVLPEGSPTNIPDHASDSEDSVSSFRSSANISIGKVALGKGVRGSTERLHWFSVLQNPRKLVSVWHTLK